MILRAIHTEEAYSKALQRLEKIFNAPAGAPEGDEAEVLSILIEKYEDEHYPIEAPDPIEAIKFRMEQMNLGDKELAEILGYQQISEILNRKRKLSIELIRNLHNKLSIPYDSLLADY